MGSLGRIICLLLWICKNSLSLGLRSGGIEQNKYMNKKTEIEDKRKQDEKNEFNKFPNNSIDLFEEEYIFSYDYSYSQSLTESLSKKKSKKNRKYHKQQKFNSKTKVNKGRELSPQTSNTRQLNNLGLVWVAMTIWCLCFCIYAVCGNEQQAIRDRRLARRARYWEEHHNRQQLREARLNDENDDNLEQHGQLNSSSSSSSESSMSYSECRRRLHVEGKEDIENEEDQEKEPEQCSICFDDFEMDSLVKKLPCGHIYHIDCISVWLSINPSCPLCRESLTPSTSTSPSRISNRQHQDVVTVVDATISILQYSAMLHPNIRFGVTIVATNGRAHQDGQDGQGGGGLLVTYVEPNGAGALQRVEVGDYLIKQDGMDIPRGISDREFVSRLVALGRPVELGFIRRIAMTYPSEHNEENEEGMDSQNNPETEVNHDDDDDEEEEEDEEDDDEEGDYDRNSVYSNVGDSDPVEVHPGQRIVELTELR